MTRVRENVSWVCVFFTRWALLGFGCGFGEFDALLKFFFQNLIDELFPFDEEEVIKVVNGTSIGGTVYHGIAIAEQGIKAIHEKVANTREGKAS